MSHSGPALQAHKSNLRHQTAFELYCESKSFSVFSEPLLALYFHHEEVSIIQQEMHGKETLQSPIY